MSNTRPVPKPRKLLKNVTQNVSNGDQFAKADGPVPAPRHSRGENDSIVNYKVDDDISSWEGGYDKTSILPWKERSEDAIKGFVDERSSETELTSSEEPKIFERQYSSQTLTQEYPRSSPVPKPRVAKRQVASKAGSSLVLQSGGRGVSTSLNTKNDNHVHDFGTVSFSPSEGMLNSDTTSEEGYFDGVDRPCLLTNTSEDFANETFKSVVNEMIVSQKRVRFLNTNFQRNNGGENSKYVSYDDAQRKMTTEMPQVSTSGKDHLNDLFSLDKILRKIDEKCNMIGRLRIKALESQTQISREASNIRRHIDMSLHASLRNIERARTRLFKKGTLRNAEGNAKETILNQCNPQLFSVICSNAKELVDVATSNEKVARLGFTLSQQFKTVLGMDCYDASSEIKLHFIEQYKFSIGRFVKRLKCVGLVALSTTCVLVVADQREEIGVCVGLWSKRTSRYRKWQVILPLKVSVLNSVVAVSSTLGTSAQSESVVVIAVGETLYTIRCSLLFRDSYTHESIVNCFKLKLGSCVSSVACVVGKSNLVAMTCHKKDVVYLYDMQGEQIVQQIEFTSGQMSFHLGFATVEESNLIKFGMIITNKENQESFICMADSKGITEKPLSRVAVNWSNLFPSHIHYHVAKGVGECLIIFRNETKKSFLSEFPYGRSTREIEFIKPLHYDKTVAGLTTLQSNTHSFVAIAYEDGQVMVLKLRHVHKS